MTSNRDLPGWLQRGHDMTLNAMQYSVAVTVSVIVPLGILARIAAWTKVYAVATALAGCGLAVFFLATVAHGVLAIIAVVLRVRREARAPRKAIDFDVRSVQLFAGRAEKKFSFKNLDGRLRRALANGEYAWMTDGRGRALRVHGREDAYRLDCFRSGDSRGKRSVRRFSLEHSTSACLAFLHGDSRWEDREWRVLRPASRRGLMMGVHLPLLALAHFAAFLGSALTAVYYVGQYELRFLIGAPLIFASSIFAVLAVQRAFMHIPARCPRCGGGAYWQGSPNVVYLCHRCPYAHDTGWRWGGDGAGGGPAS